MTPESNCKLQTTIKDILMALLYTIIILIGITAILLIIARCKGASREELKNMPFENVLTYIKTAPDLTKHESDITYPCIIVYTRPSCSDCLTITPQIEEHLDDFIIPVYYISTRSNLGESMLKKYPVASVPMIAYISEDKKPKYIDPVFVNRDGSVSYTRQKTESFLTDIQWELKNQAERKEDENAP